jgi:N-methylhydantoinase A
MVWAGAAHTTPQIPRADLAPGTDLRGPALIHEFSATTVVPPGATLSVGAWGDLSITLT